MSSFDKIGKIQKVGGWRSITVYDPLPPLLSSENKAIAYFAARDLLHKTNSSIQILKELPEVRSIIRRQQQNGSWKYPGGNSNIRSQLSYDQIETFRNLGYLIELYGYTQKDPEIESAIEFLFQFQTEEGDIRGILGNQYAPYYTAAMIELFIKAGLVHDHRIDKAFEWLASIRQDDGGWAIPFRTRKKQLSIIKARTNPLEPDRSQPFSHLITGVVLRAYAVHPKLKHSTIALNAAELLLSNLFKDDNYPDRKDKSFWLKFTFPFWFTDLISATDSLTLLGFSAEEPQIAKAMKWFVDHQSSDGLWKLKALKNKQIFDTPLWLSLAICRIMKRGYK